MGCATGHFLSYPAYFMSMRGSRVAATAHLFPSFITPQAFEAGVTVVGERVFAAVIHRDRKDLQ